jgi:hypothetical protein
MVAKAKKTARKQTSSGMRDLSARKDPRGGAQKKEIPNQGGRGGTNLTGKRGLT